MKRRIFFIALFALVLGGFAWLTLRPREPVYQGKTLTGWLTPGTNEFISSWGGTYIAYDANTIEAIRQIGASAIPTLLQMLRAHDSNLKLQLIGLAAKQHLVKLHFIPAAQQNQEAMLAFRILGPAASNAVPGLIHILSEPVSAQSKALAAYSLGLIGPAARAAVPTLVHTIDNPRSNENFRVITAVALGQIRADPGLVAPALIKCLTDTNSQVQACAAASLASLGSSAKAAIPALIPLLNNPDASVRVQAKEALKAIDPEAAAKAGVQ